MAYISRLPYPVYEDETVNTEMFDFSVLQRDALPFSSGQDNIEISQRSKDTETLDMSCIVAKKGEFAAVKHGFASKGLASKPCLFFLVQFQESDPVKRCDYLWFLEDLLPFHFKLPNLAPRTRLLCHKEFWSIQFHAKMSKRGLSGLKRSGMRKLCFWHWMKVTPQPPQRERESTNCSRRR